MSSETSDKDNGQWSSFYQYDLERPFDEQVKEAESHNDMVLVSLIRKRLRKRTLNRKELLNLHWQLLELRDKAYRPKLKSYPLSDKFRPLVETCIDIVKTKLEASE